MNSQSSLQVRIGIHTGLVVVGEIGSSEKREMLAMGETPNVAARLQSLAAPDTVVVSAATYRLIEGLLDCRDLGTQSLKGVSASAQVYQVVGEGTARSRLDVAMTRGLTPLVGRDEEVELLQRRWEQTKAGEGQVVLLNGEAGIGKSRLLQALREQLSSEKHTQLECRCSLFHQNSALYPVIDLLQRVLRFRREDMVEEKLAKLEAALIEVHGRAPVPETVSLFASLLSLPLPDHYLRLTLTPQKQKEKTQQAVLALLLQEATRQPVRFDVEDVHWADPSTLEFLSLLIERAVAARLLVLVTFRPDFTPPWALAAHVTQLSLRRLGRRQVEAMVERLAGGRTFSDEIIQQLITRTDGVPLFIEELTKNAIEAVGVHSGPLAIPTTLHDSLMARLDRMSTAKEVAQLGATIGREFSYDLLRAVSRFDEANLQQSLTKLVEAELLYQRGTAPQARYLFKHALIQDTAYQSLLKSKRQQYHNQIAQVLEGRFPEIRETQPELLAHHYTEVSIFEQAIHYWQQAGQKASQRSANTEAITHLTKGLELLKTLPDTPEHLQQELPLQIALGSVLLATKGYGSQDMERAYTRARELCQQAGHTLQLVPVLWGLWQVYVARAELQRAHELGEQLLTLAQRHQDPALFLGAHYALGFTLYYLGEFASARAHSEQGLALYDARQHRSLAFLYGQDLGLSCLTSAAWALWYLGYPEQALQKSHEALALAQELSDPFSLVIALAITAAVHQLRREGQAVQERAEAMIALCTEQEIPFFLAFGTSLRGYARAEQGQTKEGIRQISQGLAASGATGVEVEWSCWLVLLAQAYGRADQVEKGLSTLVEAQAVVDNTGVRYYEAEVYRLKGTLTLQSKVQGPKSKVEEEAEEYFLKAIEIARKQQAKSLELRAVMSLVRLRQQQVMDHSSRTTQDAPHSALAEAHKMLSEVYNWFTEGFDTKDLQEAKASAIPGCA